MEQAAAVASDPVFGAPSVIGQAWRSDLQWSVTNATMTEVSFPVCQNVNHDVVKCQTLHMQSPEDCWQAAVHLMLCFIWGWDTSPKTEITKPSAKSAGAKDQCYPTAWGWLGTAMWRQLGSRTADRESLNSVNQAPGHQRVQAFCRQATQTDTLLLPESFGCPLFAQPSLAKRVSQRKCTTLRQLKAFCNHLCQWRVPALVAT